MLPGPSVSRPKGSSAAEGSPPDPLVGPEACHGIGDSPSEEREPSSGEREREAERPAGDAGLPSPVSGHWVAVLFLDWMAGHQQGPPSAKTPERLPRPQGPSVSSTQGQGPLGKCGNGHRCNHRPRPALPAHRGRPHGDLTGTNMPGGAAGNTAPSPGLRHLRFPGQSPTPAAPGGLPALAPPRQRSLG